MFIRVLILTFFCYLPMTAVAGSDHEHGHSHDPVTQLQAEKIALESVARLVKTGKIANSWTTVGVMKTEKKKFGNNLEWVVSFTNNKISDAEKQTLYIFLSLTGDYIAANFTGK